MPTSFQCDIDLTSEIRRSFKVMRASDKGVRLAVLTTHACNLACTYCFQDRPKKPPFLSLHDVEPLAHFAAACLKRSTGALQIMWFGGEPLLNVSFILAATRRLSELAYILGRSYEASIITNGTRIHRLSERTIRDMQLTAAQITVDGPPEVHNRRRPTHSGRGSFRDTIRGVRRLTELGVATRLRVNVDADNLLHIDTLLEYLARKDLLKRVNLQFAPVRTDQRIREYYQCHPVTGEEWVRVDRYILDALNSYGALKQLTPLVPSVNFIPCSAQLRDSFVISADRLVYKCLNDPPQANKAIGPIDDPERIFQAQLDPRTWAGRLQAFAPEETSKCRNCGILSICAGGCPASRLERIESTENCSPWRYLLKPRLSYIYGKTSGSRHT